MLCVCELQRHAKVFLIQISIYKLDHSTVSLVGNEATSKNKARKKQLKSAALFSFSGNA